MPTLLYGIIGHPVKHSLSPAMQGAAFKELGIDAEYRLFDIEPAGLSAFLRDVPKNNIAGLNITIPHKIAARDYLETSGVLDENARKLGAVNTITVAEGGALRGYNTDGPGFYRSLVEDLGFEPEGRSVFVLGAGGAAKAIVMYLGNAPKKICVADIDQAKIAELAAHYKAYYDGRKLEAVAPSDIASALKECDLLVNGTPVGMSQSDPSPVEKTALRAGMYVYDLVYNRPMTQLVKEANSMKCHAITGTGMLLYQGAIAFELWTGKKAPVGVMRRALKDALKEGPGARIQDPEKIR